MQNKGLTVGRQQNQFFNLLPMQHFTDYLQSKNLKPRTIKEYKLLATYFIKWYGDEDITNCEKKDVLNYLGYLKKEKQMRAESRYNRLIALQHYFDSLIKQELIQTNPTAFIKLRGVQKRKLNYIYTPEELTELADNYYQLYVKTTLQKVEQATKRPQDQRAYLLSYQAQVRKYIALQFIVHQGLKSQEVLRLKISDIDFTKATVNIRTTTRGKDRTLPLHATQTGALMQYINEIHSLNTPTFKRENLFISVLKEQTEDTPLTGLSELSRTIRKTEPKYHSLAQLRASVITHWIKVYGLRKAQYLAGHRSITSTEKYIPNDIEDLVTDITKFNPF